MNDLPNAPRGGVFALTPSEREVLALHRAGKTNDEIATATGRRIKSVTDRLRAALDKERLALGAPRDEAAPLAPRLPATVDRLKGRRPV